MDVSVIIPAYNEENAVGTVVSQIRSVLAPAGHVVEILVINDGSSDATAARAADAGARVVSNPINMGYGFSLKRGFREATRECVVITDADGTYPVDRIPDLIVEWQKGFDMVVGARTGKAYRSNTAKSVARSCFKWMSEYVVGKKIPDINSGFRVIRRSLMLPILPDLSNTFSFSTSSTLIFMLKKYFVGYVPVAYAERVGTSKVKYVRDALIAAQIMVEIIARYNPLKLFLPIAAIPGMLFVLSFLAGAFFFSFMSLYACLSIVSIALFASMFKNK